MSSRQLLVFVCVCTLLFACGKEKSLENANGHGGSEGGAWGWSFAAAGNSFAGCVDTAYIEDAGGIKLLTIMGTDAQNNLCVITLSPQSGNFAPGKYTLTTGANIIITLANGAIFGPNQQSSFTLNVTTLNDSLIVATFTATLSDPIGGGGTIQITEGKLKAKIGMPNPCGPVDPGGNPGGNPGGGSNDYGYSFKDGLDSLFKGCIDTAYYETQNGVKALLIEGSDDAGNICFIGLVFPGGNVAPGTYPITERGVIQIYIDGQVHTTNNSGQATVNVTTINDTLVEATFSGVIPPAVGALGLQVNDGKIKARISGPNPCSN